MFEGVEIKEKQASMLWESLPGLRFGEHTGSFDLYACHREEEVGDDEGGEGGEECHGARYRNGPDELPEEERQDLEPPSPASPTARRPRGRCRRRPWSARCLLARRWSGVRWEYR